MSHRNVAHVFFFALKGSDEYEQEVPEALYGDSSSIRGAEEHPERNTLKKICSKRDVF
ncbi:hypothetical protein [Blautia wexlerae]|uniref:hypothetical protein n=1 Tax=Blautia wexlerae TaxID=418240 RepID=UPI001A9B36DC|nr:hypothetical protein [Blautia wexlerae]